MGINDVLLESATGGRPGTEAVKEVPFNIKSVPLAALHIPRPNTEGVVYLHKIVHSFLGFVHLHRNVVVPLTPKEGQVFVLHTIVTERVLDLINGVPPV